MNEAITGGKVPDSAYDTKRTQIVVGLRSGQPTPLI